MAIGTLSETGHTPPVRTVGLPLLFVWFWYFLRQGLSL